MDGQKKKKKVCQAFLDLLERLEESREEVTLVIKSGQNCCEIEGCIADIEEKCYVVIINNTNGCQKTFVRIDCICAVIVE